jgi:wyosine [tRNA(Phe)-imidazoG37] synthetase (radical SAM superfamily)
VLTNGSLQWQKELRRELAAAQLIIPSLDAGDARMFAAVNRPCEDLSFERINDGLIALGEEFSGEIWIEVFILGGYTADVFEVRKINEWVRRIKPDRVQINTVTRPPAESFAVAVNRGRLEELARLFEPEAEVIADFRGVHAQADFAATRETVLQLLERRPCSVDDLAEGLSIHRNEAVKYVEELLATNQIECVRTSNRVFYRASHARPQPVGETS